MRFYTPPGDIFTEMDYANAFFSHDEFIEFYSDDATLIEGIGESVGTN